MTIVFELVFDLWESEEMGLMDNLSTHNACLGLSNGISIWFASIIMLLIPTKVFYYFVVTFNLSIVIFALVSIQTYNIV